MEQGTTGRRNNGGLGTRELGENVQEQVDAIRERFSDATEGVVEFIRQRPGTSLLLALGAGYLLGRILRA